jgi:hypothetical protein
MVNSIDSRSMTQHQVALVEYALRHVCRIEVPPWDEIPSDLHHSFIRYMGRDVWTGLPDLLSLREASLLIVRDAITRTGEFGEGE